MSLPDTAEQTVEQALSRLVDGDRADALALLNESFPTVCESDAPRPVEPGADRTVRCHLHDPDIEVRHGQPAAPEVETTDTELS